MGFFSNIFGNDHDREVGGVLGGLCLLLPTDSNLKKAPLRKWNGHQFSQEELTRFFFGARIVALTIAVALVNLHVNGDRKRAKPIIEAMMDDFYRNLERITVRVGDIILPPEQALLTREPIYFVGEVGKNEDIDNLVSDTWSLTGPVCYLRQSQYLVDITRGMSEVVSNQKKTLGPMEFVAIHFIEQFTDKADSISPLPLPLFCETFNYFLAVIDDYCAANGKRPVSTVLTRPDRFRGTTDYALISSVYSPLSSALAIA